MTFLAGCLLGAAIGYAMASLRAPLPRPIEPNVVPLTPLDRRRLRELHYIDQDEAQRAGA